MIAMKFRTLTKVLLVFVLGGERQDFFFLKADTHMLHNVNGSLCVAFALL